MAGMDQQQNGDLIDGNTSKEKVSKKGTPFKNKGNKLLLLVQKLKLNAFNDKEGEKDDGNELTTVDQKMNIKEEQNVDHDGNIAGDHNSNNETIGSLPSTPVKPLDRRCQSTAQKISGGKRAFECDVCGYKAKWLSELQKHKLVHTNEKPFPCPHCSHRSRWKGDLTRHIQKIHKIFVQPQRSRKSAKNKMSENRKSNENVLILPSSVNKTSLLLPAVPLATNGNFVAFPGMFPIETNSIKTEVNKEKNTELQKESNSILVQKLNSEPMNNVEKKPEVPKLPPMDNGHTTVRKMVYKCKECNFYTKTASRFHVHVVQHLNKKPYMCSDCGYRSNWQWDVTKHIRVKVGKMNSHESAEVLLIDEAGEKNYEKYKPYMEFVEEYQPVSDRKVKSTTAISMEVEPVSATPKDRKLFRCKECNYEDDDRENVRRHAANHLTRFSITKNDENNANDSSFDVKTDQNGDLFMCTKCPYKSRKREFISFHAQQHYHRLDAMYRCLFCPYWVKIERNLLKHLSLHVSEPTYFLAEVDKLISDVSEREEDAVSSPSQKKRKFCCEFCPYTSNNQSQFQYHKKFHEQDEEKVHKCPNCSYSVSHPHSLQQHLKLHEKKGTEDDKILQSSERPNDAESGSQVVKMFKCRYCPLVNKRRANVKIHELMHTKLKKSQYSCNVCNYKCDGQGALTSHEKMHEHNESNFKMIEGENGEDQVQEVYIDEANVPRQRIKSNNTLSKCQNDEKDYQLDTNMNNQLDGNILGNSTKTEENALENTFKPKPKRSTPPAFHCQICPAKFSKSVRLRRHQALHGAEGKFTCPICAYSVNNSIAFQKHKHLHCETNAKPEDDGKKEWIKKSDIKIKNTEHREWLSQSLEHVKIEQEKSGGRLFSCTHCPYVHHRKDAVQNHLRRHVQQTGSFKCTYCDYNVLYDSFLRDHIKLHFTLFDHFSPKFKASLKNIEIKATDVATGEQSVIFRHEQKNKESDEAYFPDIPESLEESNTKDEDEIRQLLSDTTNEVAIKLEQNSPPPMEEAEISAAEEDKIADKDAKGVYMEAMKSVSNIEDVFSVINEYLHSGGSVSCPNKPKEEEA